jgi:hypothetical protein
LSCGQFGKTVEILSTSKEHGYLNLLFLQYCCDNNLITVDESDDATVKLSPNCIHKRLHDKVYADNAKVFYKLDNMEVFKQLCSQAGQMGEILLSN